MPNKLHGIILKKTDLKNDDKYITILTKELGKISVIAKGVKKLTSRKRGSIETFNIIKLSYTDFKSIYYLQDTLIIKSFNIAAKTTEEIISCMYILEIIDKIMPQEEPNETIFNILAKTIYFLSNNYSDNIINAFNLKILKMLGFYSSKEFKFIDEAIKSHLKDLETKTYEEIVKLNTPKQLQIATKNYLINLTEETVESKIRTIGTLNRIKLKY